MGFTITPQARKCTDTEKRLITQIVTTWERIRKTEDQLVKEIVENDEATQNMYSYMELIKSEYDKLLHMVSARQRGQNADVNRVFDEIVKRLELHQARAADRFFDALLEHFKWPFESNLKRGKKSLD